jgi:flagellar hook-associated protein 1
MSGLFGSLSIALSGLSVSQQEMETTSNNVANANTPGYTREVAVTAAGDPVQLGSLSIGTGVVFEKIESLRDSMLQIQINQATQQNSSLNSSLSQLQQIQTQFANSSSGIGADISNFFNSLEQLSPDPSDLTLRQSVLTAADTMASDFNTAAGNLATQRTNVDQNIVQTVTQVNSLTSQLAAVDQQISNVQATDPNPGTLVDQQNNLIQQLSALIGVQVIPTNSGITVATANGTALVSGSQSFALTTQVQSDGMHDIMAGTDDITSSLTGGSLAGLVQIRDQEIPSIGSTLDQLAAGLATALNSANAQGYDLEVPPVLGGNIFAPPPIGGVGAAAAMTVTMTNPTLLAASSDGSTGSNGNLANLLAVASQNIVNGQTPIDAYSNLVGQVGSATSNTSADADALNTILQQLQDQNGSVSGVSLDEEASNLIQYQSAYQAAARVVSTINLLLLDAVNLGMDEAEE